MQNEVEYRYLDETDINTAQYKSFYETFHGVGSFTKFKPKICWYYKSGAYKVLTALVDGNYAGQSTSYMAKAFVNGEEKEIWWSIDTFVLDKMRGRSIGKKLQEKLHNDLPNFSSVSYSRLNGIIKKKCGAKEVLDVRFTYYPISCYFSLLFELAFNRIVKSNISFPKIRLPYFYFRLNSFFFKLKGFQVKEIPNESFAENVSDFMEECLKDENFHIVRSIHFLKWKYIDNPMISFRALSVFKNDERIGIIILSDVYKGRYIVTKARLLKVLDCVVKPEYSRIQTKLFHKAIAYCRKKWELVPDGVLSAQRMSFSPSLNYPKVTHMLSTLKVKKIESGYISYIDQDMERMY